MKQNKIIEDYDNRCECAEDDRCGCSYPNNVMNNIECDDIKMNSSSVKIKTPKQTISYDSICYCGPEWCNCKAEHNDIGE